MIHWQDNAPRNDVYKIATCSKTLSTGQTRKKLPSKKEDGIIFAIFDTRNDHCNLIQYAKSNMAVSLSKQDVTLATKPTDIKAVGVTH